MPIKKTAQANNGEKYPEQLPGGIGSHRSSNERADRNKGTAGDHESEFCRTLSRSNAVQRSQRNFAQDRGSERTQPPPENFARSRYSRRDRGDYSHRRRRPARALLRPRFAVPARAMDGSRATDSRQASALSRF